MDFFFSPMISRISRFTYSTSALMNTREYRQSKANALYLIWWCFLLYWSDQTKWDQNGLQYRMTFLSLRVRKLRHFHGYRSKKCGRMMNIGYRCFLRRSSLWNIFSNYAQVLRKVLEFRLIHRLLAFPSNMRLASKAWIGFRVCCNACNLFHLHHIHVAITILSLEHKRLHILNHVPPILWTEQSHHLGAQRWLSQRMWLH